MNTKQLLGISIASVFAISVASVSTLPDAFAKNDFTGKPDFIAILDADQVPFKSGPWPDNTESQSKARGIAHFWMNEDETQLFYKIKLNGLSLDEAEGETPGEGRMELVTKIHLHNATAGVNGPHVLNVLGAPDRDDDDVVVNPTNAVIQGIWDNGDETFVPSESGRSKKLSENLDKICDGEIYVNIHTNLGDFENVVGAIRGQAIPQPNSYCE